MFRIVLSPNMYNHDDNHKLTCFPIGTATVIVKEICANEQATSAYTNMFNIFDHSCTDSLFGRIIFGYQDWPASVS